MNASDEPSHTAPPDELPVLTLVVESHDELPILTDVIQPSPELEFAPESLPESGHEALPAPATAPELLPEPAPRKLSDEEIQLLLKQLESRLEAIFTQKLSLHLEKLQRLAVKQAVNEFRAALPDLVREILNPPSDPKP